MEECPTKNEPVTLTIFYHSKDLIIFYNTAEEHTCLFMTTGVLIVGRYLKLW